MCSLQLGVGSLICCPEQCWQAELSSKLPHVQSLCEHEMVARAIKHVLRAVVAATEGLASAIASVFNFAFGTVPTKGRDLLWKWVKVFVQNRFHWNLSETCRLDLRPHALLRGICHKVGPSYMNCVFCPSSMARNEESVIFVGHCR